MADLAPTPATELQQQKFERVLAGEHFKGLRAILESLCRDRETLRNAVQGSASYEDLVAKLGYRIALTKQIHVQDAYSHVGPSGGIKTVLPYHDIPTHSSFPTLINYDSTVTSTPRSAEFFNELLSALKKQLSAE